MVSADSFGFHWLGEDTVQSQSLGQLLHRACWGIPKPSQCRLQDIRFHVDQDEEQAIFGGGQRTVSVGPVPPSGAFLAIEAPLLHAFLKRFLKGGHQLGKLFHGQTRSIQKRLLFLAHVGVAQSTH